ARWFLARLRTDRLHVDGQENLPTAGAVVLVTNARRPDDRQTLVLATDRYTRFLTDAGELEEASRVLRRGHLIGLTVDGESAPAQVTDWLAQLREREPGLTVVPVHSGLARVAYGPAVKAESGYAELRSAIDEAAEESPA